MIAIVDYGLGNVKAFDNVYRKLNIPSVIAKQPTQLENATKLILPGVGSWDSALQRLQASGLRQCLDEIVHRNHVPVLGVCVGMQILADSSEEGHLPGLGWISGEVRKFKFFSLPRPLSVPHMGWNDVQPKRTNSLLKGLEHDAHFYFLHSYYFNCEKQDDIIAVTDYGGWFSSVVNCGNIFGVQFHPEKSHYCGIQLLKNFAEL
jgi:glutamine amidotransferase